MYGAIQMFQMREAYNKQNSWEEICLPALRKQNILQTAQPDCQAQGGIMDSDISAKIEEMKVIEMHLHNLLAQKQSVQVELNEIDNAIDEVARAKDEMYRVVSGVMIKSDKKTIEKELSDKKKVLEMKVDAIEKQENLLEKKMEERKKEVEGRIFKKGK